MRRTTSASTAVLTIVSPLLRGKPVIHQGMPVISCHGTGQLYEFIGDQHYMYQNLKARNCIWMPCLTLALGENEYNFSWACRGEEPQNNWKHPPASNPMLPTCWHWAALLFSTSMKSHCFFKVPGSP
jgi:hypothetical protein